MTLSRATGAIDCPKYHDHYNKRTSCGTSQRYNRPHIHPQLPPQTFQRMQVFQNQLQATPINEVTQGMTQATLETKQRTVLHSQYRFSSHSKVWYQDLNTDFGQQQINERLDSIEQNNIYQYNYHLPNNRDDKVGMLGGMPESPLVGQPCRLAAHDMRGKTKLGRPVGTRKGANLYLTTGKPNCKIKPRPFLTKPAVPVKLNLPKRRYKKKGSIIDIARSKKSDEISTAEKRSMIQGLQNILADKLQQKQTSNTTELFGEDKETLPTHLPQNSKTEQISLTRVESMTAEIYKGCFKVLSDAVVKSNCVKSSVILQKTWFDYTLPEDVETQKTVNGHPVNSATREFSTSEPFTKMIKDDRLTEKCTFQTKGINKVIEDCSKDCHNFQATTGLIFTQAIKMLS